MSLLFCLGILRFLSLLFLYGSLCIIVIIYNIYIYFLLYNYISYITFLVILKITINVIVHVQMQWNSSLYIYN